MGLQVLPSLWKMFPTLGKMFRKVGITFRDGYGTIIEIFFIKRRLAACSKIGLWTINIKSRKTKSPKQDRKLFNTRLKSLSNAATPKPVCPQNRRSMQKLQ